MKLALETAATLALLAAALCFAGAFAVEREVYLRVPPILEHADTAFQNLDQGSQSILKLTSTQLASINEEIKESRKATADIKQFFGHLDLAVNGRWNHPGLIPTATRVLDQQNESLLKLEGQATIALNHLDDALQQATPLLARLTDASANLAALAADPAIKEALQRLDDSIAETDSILVEIHGIAASGNRMAEIIENRLRQALAPASLAKRAFMTLLQIAGPASQIATAAKR